jgi:hypothetical protein
MIEKVEELATETQALVFANLDNLGEREINVRLSRADNAVARRVSKPG